MAQALPFISGHWLSFLQFLVSSYEDDIFSFQNKDLLIFSDYTPQSCRVHSGAKWRLEGKDDIRNSRCYKNTLQ
jgi:hypothetical protein